MLENKGGKKINNIEISKKKLKLQGRPSFTMSEWLYDCMTVYILI